MHHGEHILFAIRFEIAFLVNSWMSGRKEERKTSWSIKAEFLRYDINRTERNESEQKKILFHFDEFVSF